MPEIIEKLLIGKGKESEDGMFIGDNFLAVVDGVTSKGSHKFNGHTGGWYAKEIVLEAIKGLPKDIAGEGAMLKLNKAILDGYKDYLETAREKIEERMQACVIIFSVYMNEIWVFGDCQCIINNVLYKNEKKFDEIVSDMRALVLEAYMLQGKTQLELLEDDKGREFIMPILKKQGLFANLPSHLGYDVLDGFSKPCLDRMKRFKVKKGDTIILSSDGYPELRDTLEESENALKTILEKDPLCAKTYISTKGLKPGNKSFDDRTYLKFIV